MKSVKSQQNSYRIKNSIFTFLKKYKMGNWNCCNCIEKKETQINQISNIRHTQNNIKKNGIIPIKTIEFSKLKDNKANMKKNYLFIL